VRARLSAYLDDDLEAEDGRSMADHLEGCAACSGRWSSLRRALRALRELPAPAPAESLVPRLLAHLEIESRGPGLALLFRRGWGARPLLLRSLLPAALACIVGLGAAVVLDTVPSVVRGRGWAWLEDAEPLPPVAGASVPRLLDPVLADDFIPSGEDSLFFETRVLRDGRVGEVTLLHGRAAEAAPLMNALRRERFEPARYRGRPVAANVYRLISRLDVRAPET
jgi:hypothetical protein